MKWNFSFRVLVLSVWCLASFNVHFVTSATTTAETFSSESTTVVAGVLDSGTWKYPKLCYVEKSKVNELIARMNQTVQILNRKDAYLKCNERIEAAVVEVEDIELCDDDRILKIQKDLSEVAAGLFQLAIRLSEPLEEDVDSLDRKKFQLVYDLKAIRVFYGPSPCNENSIALYPFQPLVEYVEWNLSQVFVLFQTTRPTRPSPPATTTTLAIPSTTPKPSEEDMLNPHASFAELTEMVRANPKAMSRALPRIVSQRYNEKASTFDKLLNFTEGLPTTENQIFGVSAIHDEMYRYKRNPELQNLGKIANTVERLNQSASASTVNEAAASKLTDLKNDPDLGSIIILQNPQRSFKELIEMARSNPTAMSNAMPEIIAQRYNASVSQFKELVDLVENLPTHENQIFGLAAIHDAIIHQNQTLEMSQQWLQLARSVQRLNESSYSTHDSFARAKFADLIKDAELNAMLLMLNSGNSFPELTEMARSNPTAMSKVLPEIISQRWTVNTSTLDSLLAFAEGLLTTENRIIGVSAIHDEMHRDNQNPESLALVKMAKSVKRLNESASTTSEPVAAAAISKLTDLVHDPDLGPLMLMLNPDLSLLELTEMARSNPTAMSKVLPEIISQHLSRNSSTLDGLLAFAEGLPTTENQIIGVSAIHDEMYRYNRNPESLALVKMAKTVERLNESASTTSEPVNAAVISKLTDLVHDSDLGPLMLMLNPDLSLLELAEISRSNPTAMSRALPQIIAEHWTVNVSSLDGILTFVEGLPTTENQIIGLVAIREEFYRFESNPEPLKLMKLSNSVHRVNESATMNSSLADGTGTSKFADLLNDPALNPLNLLLNPQRSIPELTEMARLNPTAMTIALPEIVSQRYNASTSSFENLLNFIEGLPTAKNKILGVSAIHDEMYRYNRNPEPQKLMKMATTVQHLNQSASTFAVDEAAISKLSELIRDPELSPIFVLRNPRSSYKQLTESARLNPTAMSIAFPEIVSQHYNASTPSFENLLNFIEGLPTSENKISGFAAVYDEILRYSRSPDVPKILKMAKTVKRLKETAGFSLGVTSSAQLKLADVVNNLRSLTLIGEKAECIVTNVAYQRRLYAQDYGSPDSAYLFGTSSDYRFKVYPKIKDGRLVFRISRDGVQYPFYASDTNPNTHSETPKYRTQPSERFVLMHWEGILPRDAEIDWKLVPIENKANQFKILSAKFDDFMFAHQSATGTDSDRRVLLGRKSHSNHAHVPEADNWTFNCKPGTFTIPAN